MLQIKAFLKILLFYNLWNATNAQSSLYFEDLPVEEDPVGVVVIQNCSHCCSEIYNKTYFRENCFRGCEAIEQKVSATDICMSSRHCQTAVDYARTGDGYQRLEVVP
eukprot:snap_masked-scaffold_1-processed-gene-25.40-mRNA-1 protein AED:1.00 eAED:1.00 QI:0/-1/0/0/-1/1/1/0/106